VEAMTVNGVLLVIGFGIAAPIVAQDGPAKFQLPTPVQVHGVVVDSAGDPIAEVRIDNIALPEDFAKADASGRFEFVARGPSVVFRKSGWTSRLVRVSSSTGNIRVVLERAGDPPPLRNCGKKEKCGTAPLGGFCFPKVRGVGAGNWVPTLDTLEQQFSIHSWFGLDRTMLHGAGPSWGGPQPRVQEIWDSVEFSETERKARGQMVLDARGKTSDGKLWRSIGQSGESAFYYRQEPGDAMLFSRVLDGLCVLVANR
jgi:hypothetical protein